MTWQHKLERSVRRLSMELIGDNGGYFMLRNSPEPFVKIMCEGGYNKTIYGKDMRECAVKARRDLRNWCLYAFSRSYKDTRWWDDPIK